MSGVNDLAIDRAVLVVVDVHEHTVVGRYLEKFNAVQRNDLLLQYTTTANYPSALTEASELAPQDRDLLLALCDAYSASGRGKEAVEVLQKIVDAARARTAGSRNVSTTPMLRESSNTITTSGQLSLPRIHTRSSYRSPSARSFSRIASQRSMYSRALMSGRAPTPPFCAIASRSERWEFTTSVIFGFFRLEMFFDQISERSASLRSYAT